MWAAGSVPGFQQRRTNCATAPKVEAPQLQENKELRHFLCEYLLPRAERPCGMHEDAQCRALLAVARYLSFPARSTVSLIILSAARNPNPIISGTTPFTPSRTPL